MNATGSLEGRILLETTRVTSENFPGALTALQGCWKSSSILWMHVNRFPTLSGLILGGWFPESQESVVHFCRQRNLSELLLRIEKPGQRWTRRRGGYTIPLETAQKLVQDLAADGMIAIFLEPASPYTHLFSLTSVC